ncbi:MAG: DUF2752 domain-containing protein [Pyrinomonadaceae bacterium]
MFAETLNPRLLAAFSWLTLAFATVYLFIFEPGKSGFFPVCTFHALTGFACPGCGSTRVIHALIHGDVVAAFKFNPLFVLSLPFLLYAFARFTNAAIQNRQLRGNQLDAKYIRIIFGVVLFFWIFRNTPFYPFPA